MVFGEVFAASGWPRDEVTIATKLWWEFWPQTPAQELEASLERTGLERFDFVYSDPPPPDLPMADVVGSVAELVADGRVRAWGIVNWPAERVAEAGRVAHELGVAPPCAAQLPYSLIARDWVESPEMTEALLACGAKVVASYVLAGGILSGKYADGRRRPDGRRGRRPALGGRRARGARARGAGRRGRHDAGRAGDGLRAHQLAGRDDPLRRHLAASRSARTWRPPTWSGPSRRASSSGCGRSGSDRAHSQRTAVLIGLGRAPRVDAALTVVTSTSASSAMVSAPAAKVGRSEV